MTEVLRAEIVEGYWNNGAVLPYGLKTEHVKQAVLDTYSFLYNVNRLLVGEGFGFLEHTVLGNTFSGMLSEILVKGIAKHCRSIVRNKRIGCHPDLIPPGRYPNDSVLRGDEGIEIKTSRQGGGWQAHNAEKCWVMIFRYEMGNPEDPLDRRQPVRFVQILAADLEVKDWSLAERRKTSRRTRTTSINERGMAKLRNNPVYQDPAFIVAPSAKLRAHYRTLHKNFKKPT